MTRIEGRSLSAARDELSARDRRIAAGVLGEWVARLHSVPVPAQVLAAHGSYSDFLSARRNGLAERLASWRSLPASLPRRVPAFVDRWMPADEHVRAGTLLVHSDLHGDHVLGAGDPWRAASIIDFGDAGSADPLYELGPLVTGALDGDRVLLAEFLRGYGWEIEDRETFARRALATALLHDFDVFSAWRERIASVRSLDELALRFFSQPWARGRVLAALSRRA